MLQACHIGVSGRSKVWEPEKGNQSTIRFMTNSIVRRDIASVAKPAAQPLSAISEDTALALEAAATQAVTGFTAASSGSILAQLEVAANIEQLRILFDNPQIKARIIALQDAPIGFRTDRDPKIKNFQTGKNNEPYPYEIVKDIAIEASLRGLMLVGNQFNILASRFYCTKEGFEALIRRLDFVADFRPIIGIPQVKNGGVIIDCSATWKQNESLKDMTASIPIKENKGGTADQYIGKATRKLLKRCYEMMTGNSISDGDAEDSQPLLPTGPAHAITGQASHEQAPVAPAVAAAAAPVAGLTPQQIQVIMTAAERQLSPVGVVAFTADVLTTFGASELQEIPADQQRSIMGGLASSAYRTQWDQGNSQAGDQILSDEEIAELQGEPEPDATPKPEPAAEASTAEETEDDGVGQMELA
jgi:hypothetical protein